MFKTISLWWLGSIWLTSYMWSFSPFSIVKFWDTRNMKNAATKTCPHSNSNAKVSLLNVGYTSGQVNHVMLIDRSKEVWHMDLYFNTNQSFSLQERRLHGISSLSQDLNGVFISASCMDNRYIMHICLWNLNY